MELLPAQRNIRILQERAEFTDNMLRTHDAAIMVCEHEHAEILLEKLPLGSTWRQLYRQAKAAGPVGVLVTSLTIANTPSTRGSARAAGSARANGRAPGQARVLPLVLAFAKADLSAFERLNLAARAWKALAAPSGARIVLSAHGLAPASAAGMLEALLAAALAGSAPMPTCKSQPRDKNTPSRFILAGATAEKVDTARCNAIDRGNHLARWLTMLPPNVLDSANYPRILRRLARQHGWQCSFLDETALRRLGAGAFLAVSRANRHRRAGIVRLHYRGTGRRAAAAETLRSLALVGKGICFDTGGINLKTHKGMYRMHEDMQGSAVAVGTLLALSELKVPYDIDCWLAITENEIGAHAFRPQEVVQAANGTSIQIVHSDAEGRMVLADTLALAAGARRISRTGMPAARRPDLLIDFATLTGACIGALTERYSGIFTNRADWNGVLERHGRDCGERVWPFPMDEDFDSELESPIADILQCAMDGKGDHILAARFLNRFVPAEIPWIHLDLAAANRTGGLGHIPTDCTGFGVRYVTTLLLERSLWPPHGTARRPRTRRAPATTSNTRIGAST
ncbi:M17 family metallopeptidase [Steroidobacter denitrificans]|uniref:M17 family metallopeptidase n=1 Tax=Steroidobacter denitrificans TaxID=465721 RepID=UPI0012EE9730|nr:M17 family metallopeptidase [Steroidobacter denitrificans]